MIEQECPGEKHQASGHIRRRAAAMTSDELQIRELIHRQCGDISCAVDTPLDWLTCSRDFFDGALVFQAHRPVDAIPVEHLSTRMGELRDCTDAAHRRERVTHVEVLIFERVAVALAGCQLLDDERDVTCDVNAFLLIKDQGRWLIASQAWAESDQPFTAP